jgi:Ca2+-transporting ATPase
VQEFKSPIVGLLIFAGSISFFVGERAEGVAIFSVVLLNLGFTLFQVYKADNAIASLKALILEKCLVVRDGARKNINTEELTIGDIVYLEAGSKVPADLQILEATHTEVNESILTGESQLVEKNVSDSTAGKLLMGTSIVIGQIYGKVIAIGSQTEFGKIAETITQVDEIETNLQKKLHHLTKNLGILGICGAVLVCILAFVKDKGILESFLLTISLTVAIVPEGLPAVMTAILSIGVGKMAKEGVIMRRLDAIETMGDITVLATDKTGTLTQNSMKVENVWFRDSWKTKLSVDEIIRLAFVQNISITKLPKIDGGFEYIGDPTEAALCEYVDKKNWDETENNFVKIDETPFSSETRTRSITVKKGGSTYVSINGAPESILELSKHITEDEKALITKELQKNASKGFRTIAFGVGSDIQSVEFIGFASLKDPLRPGIKGAIEEAESMGIKTILITGDNPLTAEAIAVEAGIVTKEGSYITGDMLDVLGDAELEEILKTTSVFARISPIQKLRLVLALQKMGEVVAMTGDGVNDAPALKQADVGVAMGKVGTDVAKEAADAVVTDDNYITMISGIKEGRAIVRRIELATMFFIAGNMGEFLYIVIALLLNLPLISGLQILYINLITDALPALALSFAIVKTSAYKKEKSPKLLGKSEYTYIAITSVILSLTTIAITWQFKDQPSVARTVGFVVIMMLQQIMLVDVWLGLVRHASDIKKLCNKSIIAAVGITLVAVYSIFNNSFFTELFELSKIPFSAYVYFLYGVAVYFGYVFTRASDYKK